MFKYVKHTSLFCSKFVEEKYNVQMVLVTVQIRPKLRTYKAKVTASLECKYFERFNSLDWQNPWHRKNQVPTSQLRTPTLSFWNKLKTFASKTAACVNYLHEIKQLQVTICHTHPKMTPQNQLIFWNQSFLVDPPLGLNLL